MPQIYHGSLQADNPFGEAKGWEGAMKRVMINPQIGIAAIGISGIAALVAFVLLQSLGLVSACLLIQASIGFFTRSRISFGNSADLPQFSREGRR